MDALENQLILHQNHNAATDDVINLRILIPNMVAGAIIGKGGETVEKVQYETGAHVKMSKTNEFYPGTYERICLITGHVESVVRVSEFIMAKMHERCYLPNLDNHGSLAERQNQVKIIVSSSSFGNNKLGNIIHEIEEKTGTNIQTLTNYDYTSLPECCITISGNYAANRLAVCMIVDYMREGSLTGPLAHSLHQSVEELSISSTYNRCNDDLHNNGIDNSLTSVNVNRFPFIISDNNGRSEHIEDAWNEIQLFLKQLGYDEYATHDICSSLHTLIAYRIKPSGLPKFVLASLSHIVDFGLFLDLNKILSTINNSHPLFDGSTKLNKSMYSSSLSRQDISSLSYNVINPSFANNKEVPNYVMSDGSLYNENSFGLYTGMQCSPSNDSLYTLTQQELEIPENIVGVILGHRGVSINQLQAASSTSIQISKKGVFAPGTRNRIVSVTGPAHCVTYAVSAITQLIQEEEMKRAMARLSCQ